MLTGRPHDAQKHVDQAGVPVIVVRTLVEARQWLRKTTLGSRRFGLVASSGCSRLRPYGIEVSAGLRKDAAAQNEAMIAATVETGQRNMSALEQSVIKDNTLMPGEWYGGQLHLAPPTDQGGAAKTYTIVITVGTDRHLIDISQERAGA